MPFERIRYQERIVRSDFASSFTHTHADEHHIIFVQNTLGSLEIDRKVYPYKKHFLYYSPAGVEHTSMHKTGLHYYSIDFKTHDEHLLNELKKLPYEIEPSNKDTVLSLFLQMSLYKYSQHPLAEHFIYSYADTLLTMLLDKRFPLNISIKEPLNSYATIGKYDSFERLVEHLRTNASSYHTINDMCKASGYKRRRIIQLFNERLSTTPHQFLNQQRIILAYDYLENTDISVTDIGINIGFKSHNAFLSAFRKYANCSPSEYRKKHKLN